MTESLDPAQVAEWNNWPREASVLQIMDAEEAEACSNETVTINDTLVSVGKEKMVDNDQGAQLKTAKRKKCMHVIKNKTVKKKTMMTITGKDKEFVSPYEHHRGKG